MTGRDTGEREATAFALQAVPVPKDSADNLFIDAVKAKMLGDKEAAFRRYSSYAASNPTNATAHYELSRLWLERNNLPRALGEIRLALQHDSVNKWMLKQYADLLSFDEQYVAAAAIYGKIASRERAPEEFLTWEAMLYQKAGKYNEALAVLDKLSQFTGADDESLILQRQQLFLSMNNVEAAAGEVRKLIGYYPREPRYALLLAELYDNNNIKDKAAEAYKRAETLFPEDASVQFALVQYHLKNKNFERMEHYMEKAVLNRNMDMEDRIGLLVPFLRYRSIDSTSRSIAFNLSKKLAHQEPMRVEAISLYGDLLADEGRLPEALTQYKKVLGIDSMKFAYWYQVLNYSSVLQENDSVTAFSERAAKLFPKEPIVYYMGGRGYVMLKQSEKAIRFLNKAVEYQANGSAELLPEVLALLGDVYHTEGRYRASDSCYKAVIDLQPDNTYALNNYSYYLSVRGENLDEAEKMSAKSLKLRPDEATFLDTYGWILYRQGKYKEAKAYILKAIEAGKNNVDATLWEHLGDIEYKLGNKDEALEHWKKAMSMGEQSDSLQRKIKEKKLND
jgi:tetratricopeptide (TPR) repeat protein